MLKDYPLSVLVLDFKKEAETRKCLQSLKEHMKVPCKIVLLDNGAAEDYAWKFYKDGLCDTLISKKDSQGGGIGQTDLFRWCDTEYALFVQQDQVLMYDFTDKVLNRCIEMLDQGFKCVDLNGDQSRKGIWTDRAHFIETEFFNSLAPFPNGGPGPRHHDRWNENYLQEVFEKNGYQIAHMEPVMFQDIGVWTVREINGGLVKMRTDTKQVWWPKPPTEKYVFPEHTELEWAIVLGGCWEDGKIPQIYLDKGESFKYWTGQEIL